MTALTETGEESRSVCHVRTGLGGLSSLTEEDREASPLRHPGLVLTGVGDVEVGALQQHALPPPCLLEAEGDQVQTTALPLAPPQPEALVAPLHW